MNCPSTSITKNASLSEARRYHRINKRKKVSLKSDKQIKKSYKQLLREWVDDLTEEEASVWCRNLPKLMALYDACKRLVNLDIVKERF